MGPIKNPVRVPRMLHIQNPVGTAGTFEGREPPKEIDSMSFKRNRDTGNMEVTQDGRYAHKTTGDAFQFRKGQVVSDDDAQVLERTGPWPGETDEEDAAVSGAKKAAEPENKAAPAPEAKNK
jgi:hypothetical protein